MAKCEVKLPDSMYEAFTKLADRIDEVLTATLEAGGKVALSAAKSNLSRAVTGVSGRSTGQLMGSIGLSPVDVNNKGNHNIKVGFAEPRREQPTGGKYGKYKKTNAMVANILEYGKKGQSAKPFMRPAKVSSKSAAIEAMKTTFDAELNKLGVK